MIELFYANTPNGRKISIMLEEIEIEYKITEIDLSDKRVSVDNGDIILYTDLVIAVGCRGPHPAKVFEKTAKDAAREYRDLGNEVK